MKEMKCKILNLILFSLSLQEKLQFTERVRKLTNDGLASVISFD